MPRLRRQLVDEALDREAVGDLARRADVRGPQRRRPSQCAVHLDRVRRRRADRRSATPGRSAWPSGWRKPGGAAARAAASIRRLAVARGTHISVSQASMRPSGVERAAQLEQLRRALRIPAELVLARSTARAPAGRPPATAAPHRRRRRRGRSCRSSRRRRGRSRAPCRAAARAARRRRCGSGGWPATPSRPCAPSARTSATAHDGPDRAVRLHRPVVGGAQRVGARRAERRCAARRPCWRSFPRRRTGRARPVGHRRRAPISGALSLHCTFSSRAARTAAHSSSAHDADEILDAHHAHAGQAARSRIRRPPAASRRPPAAAPRGRAACRAPRSRARRRGGR